MGNKSQKTNKSRNKMSAEDKSRNKMIEENKMVKWHEHLNT